MGLKRYQHKGDDHFITFSCCRREPYFTATASKDIFLDSLELTRKRYNFEVLGYVVMPEHVHLLLSESLDYETPLSKALQSLKVSVSKRLTPRPFWQTRYYDFNVFTHNKRVEKLKYTCTAIQSPEASFESLRIGHGPPIVTISSTNPAQSGYP